jgi:hypothetical protein
MITVLYQFPRSTNQQALDDFLEVELLPGLKGAEGLNSLQMSSGDLMSAGGPPPVSKVVQAFFLSLEALFAYVQSPAGLATQEFLEETGTLIVFYEVEEL